MRTPTLPVVALLATLSLAGCMGEEPRADARTYREMGFDGQTWPRLDDVTLTILDHGAFTAFDDAKALFENLTGARVEHVSADDSGNMLQRAVGEKGDPTFDVVYGIDNVLWVRALNEGIFEPYTPLLADRVDPSYVFFEDGLLPEAGTSWPATPVDHGYVAVNWDPAHPALANATLATLDDVAAHAEKFVTPDPRTSTPGLGFLLATIATYGEPGWKSYWNDLFEGGVLVTSGWTEAYEQHFTAGYGASSGGLADKPIVTSYTTSPAYEAYFERDPETLAEVLVAPHSTFHQVQTMGIAKGTRNLAAAQAWIEFTLTDEFQALAAPGNAVYPVVDGVEVNGTFGGIDPPPGSFQPAVFDVVTLGANVERWVREWTELCEAADCA